MIYSINSYHLVDLEGVVAFGMVVERLADARGTLAVVATGHK